MKFTDILMACLVLLAYSRGYKHKKAIAICAAVYYFCRVLQFML